MCAQSRSTCAASRHGSCYCVVPSAHNHIVGIVAGGGGVSARGNQPPDATCQVGSESSGSEGSFDEGAIEAVLGEILGEEPLSNRDLGEESSDHGDAQDARDGVVGSQLVGGADNLPSNPSARQDRMELPPPPAMPRRSRPAPSEASSVQRDAVDAIGALANGHISYYHKGDRFQATCTQPGHVRCRLTRTSRASDRRSAQGRLVGLMCAWLATTCTPQDHRNAFLLQSFNKDVRRAARVAARAEDGMSALEACERARREVEDSEPEGLP